MRPWRAYAAWLLLLGACGGSHPRAAPDPLALRVASTDARDAAPDLVAEAEAALAAARRAPDAEGRALHRQRAQLWLDAAAVEQRRIAASRALGVLLARIDAADATRIAAQGELRRIEAGRRRQQAARAAQQAARRALSLSAGGGSASDAELDAAAAALRQRARLVVAAAATLGAPAPALERAAEALAQAERQVRDTRGARVRLGAARVCLDAARAALGAARALRAQPTTAEGAALRADAADLGLPLSRAAGGPALDLGEPFAAGLRLSPAGRATLAQVRTLLLAHPHGKLTLAVAPTSAGPAARGLSERRAARLGEALSLGPRWTVSPTALAGSPGQARLVLTAY